jgi:hypothetical protein
MYFDSCIVALVEKTFGRLCQLFLSVRILSSSCSNLSTVWSVSTVKRPLHRRCSCASLRLINLKSCAGSDGATRFILSLSSLFFEIIVLRRPLLSCKHTKRAGVHLISGGGGTSPVPDLFSPFWGEGGISPPFGLHACTLCMLVVHEACGVFRTFWQGECEDCPPNPAKNRDLSWGCTARDVREQPNSSTPAARTMVTAGVCLDLQACNERAQPNARLLHALGQGRLEFSERFTTEARTIRFWAFPVRSTGALVQHLSLRTRSRLLSKPCFTRTSRRARAPNFPRSHGVRSAGT